MKESESFETTKDRPYRRFHLWALFRAFEMTTYRKYWNHHKRPPERAFLMWEGNRYFVKVPWKRKIKIGETRSYKGGFCIALNEEGEKLYGAILDEMNSWGTIPEVRVPIPKGMFD